MESFQGNKVRTSRIIFLINNVSDIHFCLIMPATNFCVWFGISMNQENKFQNIPPNFMVICSSLLEQSQKTAKI